MFYNQDEYINTDTGGTVYNHKYIVKQFNTSTFTWSDGGELISTVNDIYDTIPNIDITNMFYLNGVFYSYEANKYLDYSNNYIYSLVYDPSKNIDERWGSIQNALPAYKSGNQLHYICSNGNKIYYNNWKYIYEYDVTNHTVIYHQFSTLFTNAISGFCAQGKTYIYNESNIYEFNFAAGTLNSYSYPFQMLTSEELHKGSDGNIYYFNKKNVANSHQYIYRFNPALQEPWMLISYKLFEAARGKVIMGNSEAFLPIGVNQYIYSNDNINYGGFEKVKLTVQEDNSTRLRTDNTYNSYKQLVKSTVTSFGENSKKEQYSESWDYLSGHNVLNSSTDRLGNKTAYEYTNSPYYLPAKITLYAGTSNEQITVNTLTPDSKNIDLSTVTYKDRQLITDYDYDYEPSNPNHNYPGNKIKEILKEKKNNEAERTLSTIQYEYNTDVDSKVNDANAYVTKKTLKDVVTNGTDFNLSTPKSFETNYTYFFNSGLLKTETDAKTQTTQYEYNKNGWVTKIINPDNTFKQTSYNFSIDGNNIITTSYNNQYTTVDYYDGLGRIERNCEKINGVTEKILSRYVHNGNLIKDVYDAENNKTSYKYDAFDRVISACTYDVNGNVCDSKEVVFDDFNLTKRLKIGDKSSKTYYDVLGRDIKQEINSNAGLCVTQKAYDYLGNVWKVTDPNLGVTEYIYNDMNQLKTVKNALNEETTYEYDSLGYSSKITTAGGSTTTNEFDQLGRLLKRSDSLGAADYYSYDNVGNLIASKDRKQQITSYVYKPNTSYLQQFTTGDMNINYTYDNLGTKLTMTDQTGKTSYDYYYNNKLKTVTMPDSKQLTYTYYDNGLVNTVKDYFNNTVEYRYDGANRLQYVYNNAELAAQYDYNLDGTRKSVTYPNNAMVSYEYDDANRLTKLTNKLLPSNTVVNTYDYTYDKNSNQLSKVDSSGTTGYQYDAINRIKKVTDADTTITQYGYNKNGNILTKDTIHPATFNFAYKSGGVDKQMNGILSDTINYTYDLNNKLNQTREILTNATNNDSTPQGPLEVMSTYDYDANGNNTQVKKTGNIDEDVVSYSYNPLNQMEAATVKGEITKYTYDGNGLRTSKSTNGNTTKYYLSGDTVINETQNSSFSARNIIGAGIIGRQNNGSAMAYMLKNGHGDVVNLVQNGAVNATYDYDIWGNSKLESGTAAASNPIRYAGEYYDKETGSIYLRARYYDPATSRMLSEDPIRSGTNWYVYCENNPVNRIDPSGLDSYVFYDEEAFSDQAVTQQKQLEEQYGTAVHMMPISSSDSFVENWNSMGSDGITIDGVALLFHGSPFTIFLGEGKQLTASTQGTTPSGYSAIYVGDLENKSMDSLNILSCNGGHLDYIYSSDKYKEIGIHHNIAVEFLLTNNISTVRAWDGSASYTKWFGSYYPRLAFDQKAFKSWTPDRRYLGKRSPMGEINYWNDGKGDVIWYPSSGY